jgi:FkbM family methyltransferase
MMRRFLYVLLGPRGYLRVVSRAFFVLFRGGWLRSRPAYFDHYVAETLIREGDRVIDIGANLGYYALPFSDRVGPAGRVFAVEPVELFRDVMAANLAGRSNVEVLACALGHTDGIEVEIGIPSGHPHFRHGLAHVLTPGERESQVMVFTATMRHPMGLFGNLESLDYVKCDVEGYEAHILPLMVPLFERLHPIVQVETAGESRQKMLALFSGMGYHSFRAGKHHVHPLTGEDATHHGGDLLFIHPSRSVQVNTATPTRSGQVGTPSTDQPVSTRPDKSLTRVVLTWGATVGFF